MSISYFENFFKITERNTEETKSNKQFSLNLTGMSETSTVASLTMYLINSSYS